jgi:hypothetical protein
MGLVMYYRVLVHFRYVNVAFRMTVRMPTASHYSVLYAHINHTEIAIQ